MAVDLDKFIKVMLMTTSTHDGEVLNAIRMANAMLVEQNINWREFLEKIYDAKKTKGKKHSADTDIDTMFEELMQSIHPRKSFYRFVESVYESYLENGFLTPAQYDAIKKAHSHIRR